MASAAAACIKTFLQAFEESLAHAIHLVVPVGALQDIIGVINLPRVGSAEFRMTDLALRISALERRAGYEHQSAQEGETGTFPAIASHRGQGTIAPTDHTQPTQTLWIH